MESVGWGLMQSPQKAIGNSAQVPIVAWLSGTVTDSPVQGAVVTDKYLAYAYPNQSGV